MPWWWSNLEHQWDDPPISPFLERLGSFSRLILFDQRGVGLSDPVPFNEPPMLEHWMDDLRGVLNAVGSERAAVVGHGDGGLVAMLFAATYPERTCALVLIDAYARLAADEGYPGVDQATLDAMMAAFEELWGKGDMIGLVAPSRWGDRSFRERLGRTERLSISPGAASAIQLMIGRLDVRPVLPAISIPTLVVHREGNVYVAPMLGATLPTTFLGRGMSSCLELITFTGWGTRARSSTRLRNSPPVALVRVPTIVCLPRFCSPTSSNRPIGSPS